MAKRKFKRKIFQKGNFLRKLFVFLKFFVYGSAIFSLFSLALFFYYAKDLPRPEKFSERQIALPTKIYDRTGEVLLYTIFGEEKREIIPLEEMSEDLKMAVIAAEDANFYHHFGIDLRAIFRSFLIDLKLKKPVQGGSTIPQQLIRSTFLTPEKTIKRKIREIILTLELDRRYSKDQILEWYLNQVPFGSNAYGVEAASQTFFSKKAKDITLVEAAVLASLIRSPSYLSPYGEHKNELLRRKNYVLDRMVQEGYLSQKEAEAAKKEEIKFQKPSTPIEAPHFILYLRKLLIKKYGEDFLKRKGLKVFTTLDIGLQKEAEKIVKKWGERNKNLGAHNTALVAINPQNGEVLALIGSLDYFADSYPPNCSPGRNCAFEPEFDVATLGQRQPGSAFKPFVYATAFKKGYSDQYIVIDEKTNFGVWGGKPYIPQNYDGKFRGPVTLREALAQSLNVPSVKTLVYLAGIKESVETAKDLGITSLKDASFYGPSLVLGGGEVNLLEMVSAYSVFAAGGLRNQPRFILKIEDNQGKIIEQEKNNPKRVISSKVANLINDILADNEARTPMFGPNSTLNLKGVSVKTGTTQYFNDAWTIGYNSKIVTGVWAGNNDNSPSYRQPGLVLAAPIWREFMEKAIENRK